MSKSFGDLIQRAPDVFDAERGREVLEGFGDLPANIKDVIAGTGGTSPFLRSLIEKERDWLREALDAVPEESFDGLLDAVSALEFDQLKAGLRQAKRRMALLVALFDLTAVWSLEEVTGALTRFADATVNQTLLTLVARASARGKLLSPKDPDRIAAGFVSIDMGKMGAFELNYSSDIDLICLFDDTLYDPDDVAEIRSAFVRITRDLTRILSDVTHDGYVFRTDLRLRPDAAVTPVCLSMSAAERYYESVGRNWERAAHIKARPGAGDIVAGDAYLERLSPFIWRRSLDFAAVKDAHDMRQKIRDHKGLLARSGLPGYDLKLGPGGIREIEFFAQTFQLIAGGRDPSLRLRGTVETLHRLSETGWVDAESASQLVEDYRAHREVEHRIQMIHDQQTHALPRDDEGLARVAALMGKSQAEFERDVSDRLERVDALADAFFVPEAPSAKKTELSEKAQEIVARWPGYPALRSTRAVEIFERLQPTLLEKLSETNDPDETLVHIDGFLAGLPAGVQLFSLFESNPQLIDLIVDIADISPELARYLSRNSSVFDAVIGGSFFAPWPGLEALLDEIKQALAEEPDYERKLDLVRLWNHEWHFRIGVHLLRGLITPKESAQQYADLAEASVAVLVDPVIDEFAHKYGSPPGRGISFIGMGSLGAGRLTARSDLDLIAIYDAQGVEQSDGRKPLASRSYYARLTQAFLTALTTQTAHGRLYEVDMRLRPSGRQGPVATSLAAFREYQSKEAWTWEHLALTRARPVAGNLEIGKDLQKFIGEFLVTPPERVKTITDVTEMRERLATAKPSSGGLDVKSGPGKMLDIELFAQSCALNSGVIARNVTDQLTKGGRSLGLADDEIDLLVETYAFFWSIQSAARLIGPATEDADQLGAGSRRFLSETTGCGDLNDLISEVSQRSERASQVITRCLGNPSEVS